MARPLTARLLPASPWWTASPWSSSPAASRTVTDISYYKDVDSSHLHLLESQSTMRKFKIKLKEREVEKERLRRLKESRKLESLTKAAPRVSRAPSSAEPVQVPTYIERRPGEILRVITSHVGIDFTSPDYVFQDDPMLTPYTTMSKRDFAQAKVGGKLAARYVFEKHPELFTENQIETEPKIMKFMPTARFTKEGSNEELLKVYMEGGDLVRAIKVYEAMEEREKEVSNETKEELLQMLAFNNHAQPHSEESNVVRKFGKEDEQAWESGCLADKIYSSMDPVTPVARVALLCGYASHRRHGEASKLSEECRANGIKLPVGAYNIWIGHLSLASEWERSWANIEKQLRLMVADGCRPDARTINGVLRTLKRAANRFGAPVGSKALEVMAEAKRCGIRPGLGSYRYLLEIFGHESDLILDVMSEVENGDWSTITDEDDIYFMKTAMTFASSREDLDLVYRVHKMALKEGNRVLLEDYKARPAYFSAFLKTVLKHESVEVAMETIDKFTPHFSDVTYQIREAAVQKLKDEGGYQYVPKLWADFQEAKFGGVQEMKFKLISAFLDIICHVDLAEIGMQDLVPSYKQICREGMGVLQVYSNLRSPEGRNLAKQYPLSGNKLAVKICDDVIHFCLKHGEIKTASAAMSFCRENVAELIGFLKDDTIMAFTQAMIAVGGEAEKRAAIDCIIYAMDQSMDNADAIAAEVAENFELAEEEKNKLNKMFAHETRWKMLA